MRDIEDSHSVSNRKMLLGDARVPEGHFEAGEVGELCMPLVKIEKRSSLQLGFAAEHSLINSRNDCSRFDITLANQDPSDGFGV